MTAPGWYHAEGDALGTQRYWDGTQWLGDPVYEIPAPAAPTAPPPAPFSSPPGAPPTMAPPTISPPVMPPPTPAGGPGYHPYPVGGPAGGYSAAPATTSTFPTGVKVVAIILSVLKVIPLIFMFIAVAFLSSVDGNFSDELGSDFDGLFDAAAAVIAVIALIGLLLVGFQFVGALRESPVMVFVPALIMSLLDGLLTLTSWIGWADARGSFAENSSGGPVFITAIAAAQIYVAVQSIRARNN